MLHLLTMDNRQRTTHNRLIFRAVVVAFGVLYLLAGPAWCLTGKQIQKLHRAGIRGDLLQTIIREKTVETRSLTIDELISLKKSGLTDGQIKALVIEKSFVRNRQPVHYGEDTRGIKSLSIQDIERLKAQGISDEIIRDLIIASTRDADEEQRQRAWRMLDNMRLYVY
jgi:hypothetical protein